MPLLTHLNVSDLVKSSSDSTNKHEFSFTKLKQLTYLNVNRLSVKGIGKTVIDFIASNNRKIQQLHFNGCAFINSKLIMTISTLCLNLLVLNIGIHTNNADDSNKFIEDSVLIVLTTKCRHITYLDISNQTKLTLDAYRAIARNLMDLQTIKCGKIKTLVDHYFCILLSAFEHIFELQCDDLMIIGAPSAAVLRNANLQLIENMCIGRHHFYYENNLIKFTSLQKFTPGRVADEKYTVRALF